MDVMMTTWPGFFIPPQFHVNIQNLFRVDGVVRSGMAALANVLISNFYVSMKDDFLEGRHEFWEESPLEEINLKYAAVDGYVSFQLYYQLMLIERGQQHLVPIAPPPPTPPPAPQPPTATYCPS